MKIGQHDTNKEVLVVAEVGNNHEGSMAKAEEMVKLAAEAGAGAVKFQTFKTAQFASPSDPVRYERLKSFELSYGQFESLSRLSRDLGLLFISTPLDLESAEFLGGICDALKIASGDNTFYPLMDTAAHAGLPMILSTGLADLEQIAFGKNRIEQIWKTKGLQQDIAVLHCICSYPAPPEEANLKAIQALGRQLDCTVGYSDHTMGIDASVLSVALGARIVEKHFTSDKNASDFRDHQLSADPAEMSLLVKRIEQVEQMLGSGKIGMASCEEPLLAVVRRSIVAVRDLTSGHVLTLGDLNWTRPSGGLPPGEEDKLIGRRLSCPVSQGEMITLDSLAPDSE